MNHHSFFNFKWKISLSYETENKHDPTSDVPVTHELVRPIFTELLLSYTTKYTSNEKT